MAVSVDPLLFYVQKHLGCDERMMYDEQIVSDERMISDEQIVSDERMISDVH